MIAVALATLAIGGVTASVLVANSVTASERDEFVRQAQATAQLIETELPTNRDLTVARQRFALERLLATAKAIGGHDYVESIVFTNRGPVAVPDDPLLIPALGLDLGSVRGPGATTIDIDGDSVTAFVGPLDLAGERRAWVVVGRADALIPWRIVFGRLMLGLAAAILLAAVLAAWLARSLGLRLDGLTTAAEAIAGGDLSARAPDAGGDEVARVATAFNAMAHRLEDSQRRERDFLMSVSHDLRTPLTTIRGYAEGLADDAIAPDDLARVGGVLHTQADRLSRLIDDLVLLSRLEARQFSLRTEPVDLAAHLKEAGEAMRSRADEARVRLHLDVAGVGIVEVDPDRIAQVAGNLLENALRYTPEGGAVTLRARRTHNQIRFEVADTGPGIDQADLPHVFERLYVAQRYRAVRPEGSGLGLNIVKELVDAMGGHVEFTSELGKGTTVGVVLRA